jgi:hypothetical protein
MAITTFTEYKAKKMLGLLEEAAEQVRSGKATGLLVATKLGPQHHGVGLLGDYLEDPVPVLAVASRVSYLVNQLIDKRSKPKAGGVTHIDKKK